MRDLSTIIEIVTPFIIGIIAYVIRGINKELEKRRAAEIEIYNDLQKMRELIQQREDVLRSEIKE